MSLRRLRVFDRQSALAILTLATGLAAAAIGFAVLDHVLLRPLPFPDSERLYTLHHSAPGLNLPRLEQSDATYWLYRDSPMLLGLGVHRVLDVEVTGGRAPERLTAAEVSPELLPMLGAEPIRGRLFAPEEQAPGGARAVLLSQRYWQKRFGGAGDLGPRELAETILIVDGRPRVVVGVLPSSFRYPSPEVDLWLPLGLDPQKARGALFQFSAIARLKAPDPGATPEVTDATLGDLRARLERLPANYPQSGWTVDLLGSSALTPVMTPLKDELLGGARGWIWAQATALGLLLLAACLNVATLLLVRAEDRRAEVAMRVALGASRRQLIGAHLVPALTMGLAAGILGLGLAVFGLRQLSEHGPDILSRARALVVDERTVLFTLGIALLLGVLLGLVTGLRSFSLESPARWLRSGSSTPPRQLMRTVLVTLQIGVAAALCVAAGTLGLNVFELNRVDPGFELGNASSFGVHLPSARYADAAARHGFYARTLERLRALPGAASVGAVHRLPLTGGGSNNGWRAEAAPAESAPGSENTPSVFATRWASEGYFEAMDIPLMRGRSFEPGDRELVRPVAIVSQSFASHFWGDTDPIGRRIALGTREDAPWYTVVGLVGDVRGRGLDQPVESMAYLPLRVQLPRREAPYAPAQMSFVVRGGGADLQASVLRGLINELDPELPISQPGPLKRLVRDDTAASRFALTTLLATVAVTGLLSVVGLFALISYWVRRRQREFAMHKALGAEPGQLMRQVHVRSGALTAAGTAVGLVGAGLAGGYLEPWIHGVSTFEPWVYLGVFVLFIAAAALATYGPARHAASVDPREVLRQGD